VAEVKVAGKPKRDEVALLKQQVGMGILGTFRLGPWG